MIAGEDIGLCRRPKSRRQRAEGHAETWIGQAGPTGRFLVALAPEMPDGDRLVAAAARFGPTVLTNVHKDSFGKAASG